MRKKFVGIWVGRSLAVAGARHVAPVQAAQRLTAYGSRFARSLTVAALCLFLAGVGVAGKRTTKTFTAQTATGVTASLNLDKLNIAPVEATAQLNVTGSPTTCTYQVEGSLDNVTWFDLSGGQTCTSSLMFHLDSKPVNYIRGNLTALIGGTSPDVTFIYLGVSQ